MIQNTTVNDRFSGDLFSGNDRFSGPKTPDNAILFTVSGMTVLVDNSFLEKPEFLAHEFISKVYPSEAP